MVKVKLVYFILGIVIFSVISLGSFFAGRIYENAQVSRAQNEIISPMAIMTGYDVWDAVNEYRASNNIPKLQLSEELCNNIVGRWDEVEKDQNHERFDSFVQSQKDAGRYSQDLELTELFTGGQTAQKVLANWKESPSHNQLLLDSRFKFGCSYAYNNIALLFIAEQAR